jgi:adenylyl-sulfate kinase
MKKAFVIWFTGFSQSGKTTNADAVYKELQKRGVTAQRLDGDVVRNHTTTDLGFSPKDRNKNIEIACFLAKDISEKGTIVVASFITPYKEQREMIRKELDNYIEIFCNCPLGVCENRDTKGLYKKARNKEIDNFTGISDRYDIPENADIILNTNGEKVEDNTSAIFQYLEEKKII